MSEVIFRKEKIVSLCKGKKVLHLGFIQHTFYEKKIQENDWLHSKLDEVSSKLVGVDYLANEVVKIKEKYGYECYFGDVMQLDACELKDTFDVIVCGELIEHIENPGLMLDGIKRFMNEDTTLIITTPNPWYRERIKLIKNNKLEDQWLNKEHVSWFSFETLKQLLARKGYDANGGYYYDESVTRMKKSNSLVDRIKYFFKKIVMSNTPERLYDGLFFIVKVKK
jgi:ubiquinone/menaquinone biosynthesis C-methylase UbiE